MKGVLYFLLGVSTVFIGIIIGQNNEIKKITNSTMVHGKQFVEGMKKDLASKPAVAVKKQKVVVAKKKKTSTVPTNKWVYHTNLKKGEDFDLDNARCMVKHYKISRDAENKKTVNYRAVCQGDFKLQNKVRLELAKQMLKGEG